MPCAPGAQDHLQGWKIIIIPNVEIYNFHRFAEEIIQIGEKCDPGRPFLPLCGNSPSARRSREGDLGRFSKRSSARPSGGAEQCSARQYKSASMAGAFDSNWQNVVSVWGRGVLLVKLD